MKTQSQILISDCYPEYNEKKYGRNGLNKQEKYLFQVYSRPLYCPHCKMNHTMNELKVSSPEFKGNSHNVDKIFCPVTNGELRYNHSLMAGDEWLSESA